MSAHDHDQQEARVLHLAEVAYCADVAHMAQVRQTDPDHYLDWSYHVGVNDSRLKPEACAWGQDPDTFRRHSMHTTLPVLTTGRRLTMRLSRTTGRQADASDNFLDTDEPYRMRVLARSHAPCRMFHQPEGHTPRQRHPEGAVAVCGWLLHAYGSTTTDRLSRRLRAASAARRLRRSAFPSGMNAGVPCGGFLWGHPWSRATAR
jgi:hypothetical protein